MFRYADRPGIALYAIGTICMAAPGTALPLLDLIFGQFVNTFNDFAVGNISVGHFRSEIAQARYDYLKDLYECWNLSHFRCRNGVSTVRCCFDLSLWLFL